MCPDVMAPASSASASSGTAANVSARSLVFDAALSESRDTSAIVASGNESTVDNWVISAASFAVTHALISRAVTNADAISCLDGAAFERTSAM